MDGVRKAKAKLKIKIARIREDKKASSKYIGGKRKLKKIIKQLLRTYPQIKNL